MSWLYYLSGTLLLVTIFILPIILIVLIAKPSLLNNALKTRFKLKTPLSRLKIGSIGLASLVVAFFVFTGIAAATEPASLKQANAEQALTTQQSAKAAQLKAQQLKAAATANLSKPIVTDVTTTQPIPFPSQQTNDNILAKGKTNIIQAGKNGIQTTVYTVTTIKGKETSRTVKSQTVSLQPVAQITAVGTYVAPPPAQDCPNGTYVNTAGNTVCSPYSSPSAPAGATAQCNDGTYSFSQSRSGTCSGHGGVGVWL